MTPGDIQRFLESYKTKCGRTITVVDFGNVEKWKNSLQWRVGIRELAHLVKNFSKGFQFLRRFYYGADYGHDERSTILSSWSSGILGTAKANGFEVIEKRVKYIHSGNNIHGFEKKCDLDVEMTIDLIKERDNYDDIILFSGDGDLMTAIKYLKESYNKNCIVMSARGHVAREVLEAQEKGFVAKVLFAEDFEARLNMDRFRWL